MYVCLYVCVCLKWSFVLFIKQTDNCIEYLVKNNIFDKEFENVLAYLNLCTHRSRLVVSFWGVGGRGSSNGRFTHVLQVYFIGTGAPFH